MNKTRLFEYLSKQKISKVLELFQSAFDEMNTKQRQAVFGEIYESAPPSPVQGKKLFLEIRQFYNDSIAGKYFASFKSISRNFTHVPEETEEWFEILGDFLENSAILSEQNDHSIAVKCFLLLYDLIFKMENGEEIVFAAELGSWMIPVDEKKPIDAYLKSLSHISSAEEFAEAVLPLIRRGNHRASAKQVYTSAIRYANSDQKALLLKEIKRKNVRIEFP